MKTFLKFTSILFASCLPFIFSLNGDFVFDDSEAILKNKDIVSDSWISPFYNDFWGTNIKSNLSHKSYRPLTIMSFRLNYLLSENNLVPQQFKITNLICHSVCCILVWFSHEAIIDQAVTIKRHALDVAYISALLFAVHPVHVEAICGIVGRADILAAITFFLAFLCYNKTMTKNAYTYVYLTATGINAAGSMLFKENGVTVLGFCLLYEIIIKYKRKKIKTSAVDNSELIKKSGFLIVCIIILLYSRWIVMESTTPEFKAIDNPTAFSNSMFTKVTTYSYIYFINFLLLMWPQWLCYDWSMGCVPLIQDGTDLRIVPALSIYIFGLVFVKSILKTKSQNGSKKVMLLAVLLAVVPFLPAANIVYPVGFVVAERILYIPSSGYCLLVSIGLNKLITFRRGKFMEIGVVLFSLLILFFGMRSWKRSYVWQNEKDLYVNGLQVCPLNAKVHYNVAKVADAINETEWALYEYKESIRLYPDYYQAMNNLANLLKNKKMYTEAELYLRMAINLKNDFPAAWMNLGIVLSGMGRYEESKEAYRNAIKYRRKYPDCYYNLGNLYLDMNDHVGAVENWLQSIQLNPKHEMAWTNLLALLDNTDQFDKAMELIPVAVKELPDSPTVRFAIANIYGKKEEYQEAEEQFKYAIQLFGQRVKAIHYANLGVLYHRWKRYELAEEAYKTSLKIDPSFKSSIKNLKSLQRIK